MTISITVFWHVVLNLLLSSNEGRIIVVAQYEWLWWLMYRWCVEDHWPVFTQSVQVYFTGAAWWWTVWLHPIYLRTDTISLEFWLAHLISVVISVNIISVIVITNRCIHHRTSISASMLEVNVKLCNFCRTVYCVMAIERSWRRMFYLMLSVISHELIATSCHDHMFAVHVTVKYLYFASLKCCNVTYKLFEFIKFFIAILNLTNSTMTAFHQTANVKVLNIWFFPAFLHTTAHAASCRLVTDLSQVFIVNT